jgi:hypothetical protein
MEELAILFLIFFICVSLIFWIRHVISYSKLYKSLKSENLEKGIWAPNFRTGGASWGYTHELKDILQSIGRENLNEVQIQLIVKCYNQYNIARYVLIFGFLVTFVSSALIKLL